MPKCSTEVKILNFTDIIAYINHLRFSTFSVTSENALNFGDCRYFMLWLLNILQTATFSFGLSLQMRLQLFWYDFLHISLFLSFLKRNFWFLFSSLTERSLSFRSHSEFFFSFPCCDHEKTFCSDVTYTFFGRKPNGRNVPVLREHYNVWL